MAKLYTLLKANEIQTRKIITRELKENGYSPLSHEDFIYAEGSIPVLLVAHYDTIPDPPKYINNDDGVLSAKKGLGADDRAGVYAILELIKKHHCHVLFTGGEEHGCIGATAFTKSGIKPDVNYIIEMDRRGSNDSVYYEGESEEFEKFVDSFGWKTAQGSCTDICEVAPYLGVMAVNLSIGYQHEHTPQETLDTEVMNKNIERVSKMFDGEKFEWHAREWRYNSRANSYYGYYGEDYDYDEMWYVKYVENEEDDLAEIQECLGISETEAIGYFLMNNPTLTFNSIIDVVSEYDAEEIFFEGVKYNEQDTDYIYNQQDSTDSFNFSERMDKGNKCCFMEWE